MMFLALILAGMTSKYLFPQIKWLSMGLTVVAGLCLLAVTWMNSWVGVMLIFVTSYLLGVTEIKLKTRIQLLTASGQRATVLSFYETAMELVVIGFLPILGWYMVRSGVVAVTAMAGELLVMIGVVGILVSVKEKRVKA